MIKINGKVAKSILSKPKRKIQEKLHDDESWLRLGRVVDFTVAYGEPDALEGLLYDVFELMPESEAERILAKLEDEILEND